MTLCRHKWIMFSSDLDICEECGTHRAGKISNKGKQMNNPLIDQINQDINNYLQLHIERIHAATTIVTSPVNINAVLLNIAAQFLIK